MFCLSDMLSYIYVYRPSHFKQILAAAFISVVFSLSYRLALLLVPLQSASLLSQPLFPLLLIAPHIAWENKGAQGVVILLPGTEIAIET